MTVKLNASRSSPNTYLAVFLVLLRTFRGGFVFLIRSLKKLVIVKQPAV